MEREGEEKGGEGGEGGGGGGWFHLHRKHRTRFKSALLGLSRFRVVPSLHRKKRFASFPSPAGMSLPNSPWAGRMTSYLNYSCAGGVWLVTSRHGDGKLVNLFLRCIIFSGILLFHPIPLSQCYSRFVMVPSRTTFTVELSHRPVKF
jgi:hypothetical protein